MVNKYVCRKNMFSIVLLAMACVLLIDVVIIVIDGHVDQYN